MESQEKLNSSGQPLFHLRRIGPQPTKSGVAFIMDFHGISYIIGRSPVQADFVIDSDVYMQGNSISRCHARVVRQTGNQHRLFDDSLNGVFVNNIKIRGSCVLEEGDKVTFGHPAGTKVQPGTWLRQPDSEHQFVFEKCSCNQSKEANDKEKTKEECPSTYKSTTEKIDSDIKDHTVSKNDQSFEMNAECILKDLVEIKNLLNSSIRQRCCSTVSAGTCRESISETKDDTGSPFKGISSDTRAEVQTNINQESNEPSNDGKLAYINDPRDKIVCYRSPCKDACAQTDFTERLKESNKTDSTARPKESPIKTISVQTDNDQSIENVDVNGEKPGPLQNSEANLQYSNTRSDKVESSDTTMYNMNRNVTMKSSLDHQFEMPQSFKNSEETNLQSSKTKSATNSGGNSEEEMELCDGNIDTNDRQDDILVEKVKNAEIIDDNFSQESYCKNLLCVENNSLTRNNDSYKEDSLLNEEKQQHVLCKRDNNTSEGIEKPKLKRSRSEEFYHTPIPEKTILKIDTQNNCTNKCNKGIYFHDLGIESNNDLEKETEDNFEDGSPKAVTEHYQSREITAIEKEGNSEIIPKNFTENHLDVERIEKSHNEIPPIGSSIKKCIEEDMNEDESSNFKRNCGTKRKFSDISLDVHEHNKIRVKEPLPDKLDNLRNSSEVSQRGSSYAKSIITNFVSKFFKFPKKRKKSYSLKAPSLGPVYLEDKEGNYRKFVLNVPGSPQRNVKENSCQQLKSNGDSRNSSCQELQSNKDCVIIYDRKAQLKHKQNTCKIDDLLGELTKTGPISFDIDTAEVEENYILQEDGERVGDNQEGVNKQKDVSEKEESIYNEVQNKGHIDEPHDSGEKGLLPTESQGICDGESLSSESDDDDIVNTQWQNDSSSGCMNNSAQDMIILDNDSVTDGENETEINNKDANLNSCKENLEDCQVNAVSIISNYKYGGVSFNNLEGDCFEPNSIHDRNALLKEDKPSHAEHHDIECLKDTVAVTENILEFCDRLIEHDNDKSMSISTSVCDTSIDNNKHFTDVCIKTENSSHEESLVKNFLKASENCEENTFPKSDYCFDEKSSITYDNAGGSEKGGENMKNTDQCDDIEEDEKHLQEPKTVITSADRRNHEKSPVTDCAKSNKILKVFTLRIPGDVSGSVNEKVNMTDKNLYSCGNDVSSVEKSDIHNDNIVKTVLLKIPTPFPGTHSLPDDAENEALSSVMKGDSETENVAIEKDDHSEDLDFNMSKSTNEFEVDNQVVQNASSVEDWSLYKTSLNVTYKRDVTIDGVTECNSNMFVEKTGNSKHVEKDMESVINDMSDDVKINCKCEGDRTEFRLETKFKDKESEMDEYIKNLPHEMGNDYELDDMKKGYNREWNKVKEEMDSFEDVPASECASSIGDNDDDNGNNEPWSKVSFDQPTMLFPNLNNIHMSDDETKSPVYISNYSDVIKSSGGDGLPADQLSCAFSDNDDEGLPDLDLSILNRTTEDEMENVDNVNELSNVDITEINSDDIHEESNTGDEENEQSEVEGIDNEKGDIEVTSNEHSKEEVIDNEQSDAEDINSEQSIAETMKKRQKDTEILNDDKQSKNDFSNNGLSDAVFMNNDQSETEDMNHWHNDAECMSNMQSDDEVINDELSDAEDMDNGESDSEYVDGKQSDDELFCNVQRDARDLNNGKNTDEILSIDQSDAKTMKNKQSKREVTDNQSEAEVDNEHGDGDYQSDEDFFLFDFDNPDVESTNEENAISSEKSETDIYNDWRNYIERYDGHSLSSNEACASGIKRKSDSDEFRDKRIKFEPDKSFEERRVFVPKITSSESFKESCPSSNSMTRHDSVPLTQLISNCTLPDLDCFTSTQVDTVSEKLENKVSSKSVEPDTKQKARELLARLKARRAVKQEIVECKTEMEESVDVSADITDDREENNGELQDIDSFIDRCRDIISQLKEVFDSNQTLHRVQTWRNDLARIEKRLEFPKMVIAVVGKTGDGKSSLLNALLDQKSVLPTSCMQACTSVVVEIVQNTTSEKFEADIEFLERKEWFDEVRILLNDLTGTDGKLRNRQPDQTSDAYASYCKIKAVYGKIDTFEKLLRQMLITRWLGKTKVVKSSTPEEFRRMVEKYIETQDHTSGDQFWPIVKHVRLRIPNCNVCSSGAALVDLPGIRDSNAARDKIAKEYMKNCTAIWVVSSIHRAIDDRTAKDLLGENFKRQLLMDGQYASVTFICTKTDILSPSELIRPLDLEDRTVEHSSKIRELEEEKKDIEKTVTNLTKEINELEKSLKEMKQDADELKANLEEIGSLLDPIDLENESEDFSTLKEYQDELKSKEESMEQTHNKVAELERFKTDASKTIFGLENKISVHQKEISVICALARNRYSEDRIKSDFRSGLKEMKRRAGISNTDNDEDDDDDLDDMYQDDNDTAGNLKVFCCSSTEYQKIKNLLDGQPQVFTSAEDTQIPTLRRYVHQIARVRKKQALERLIRSLGGFVFDINSYVRESKHEDSTRWKENQSAIEQEVEKLYDVLEPVIDDLSTSIESVFDDNVKPKLDEGATAAVKMANEICTKWGAKRPKDKENNRPDKPSSYLPFSTYKAVVSRDGQYHSKTFGYINFNEDLSEPMYRCMTVVWDRVFRQVQGQDRTSRSNAYGISKHRLEDMVIQLKEQITNSQREISRLVNPQIQESLSNPYHLANCECGPGTYTRMKEHMSKGIDHGRFTMFDGATKILMGRLMELQRSLIDYTKAVCRSLIQDLRVSLEPLWNESWKSNPFSEAISPVLSSVCREIRSIYTSAGLQNTEDHSDELSDQNTEPVNRSPGTTDPKIGSAATGYQSNSNSEQAGPSTETSQSSSIRISQSRCTIGRHSNVKVTSQSNDSITNQSNQYILSVLNLNGNSANQSNVRQTQSNYQRDFTLIKHANSITSVHSAKSRHTVQPSSSCGEPQQRSKAGRQYMQQSTETGAIEKDINVFNDFTNCQIKQEPGTSNSLLSANPFEENQRVHSLNLQKKGKFFDRRILFESTNTKTSTSNELTRKKSSNTQIPSVILSSQTPVEVKVEPVSAGYESQQRVNLGFIDLTEDD